MARIPGVFDFSANYEVKIVGPLDARMVVPTKADLSTSQMDDSYPYVGMLVSVTDDSVAINNGLFRLKQLPVTIPTNWVKIGSGDDAYVSCIYDGNGNLIFTKGSGIQDLVTIGAGGGVRVTGGTMTATTLTLDMSDGSFVDIDVTQYANNDIESVTLLGTNLIIELSGGQTFTEDLNNLYLTGQQFKKGITTHDFFTMNQSHFTASTFSGAFPFAVSPPAENIQFKSFTWTDFPAKETTIVLSISSSQGSHFIMKLPEKSGVSDNHLGKRIRVFMKRNNITDKTKRFMLATSYTTGVDNRIVSVQANTLVVNLGSFLPLEAMEVIDLFWDGDDWIALAAGKQEYALFEANTYQTDISTYLNRS